MHRPQPQSFLLRLWREHAGGPLRATLVPVGQPDAPRHFATIGELSTFLREQAGEEVGIAGAWDSTYEPERKAGDTSSV